MSDQHTCAACGGVITNTIHTVYWEGYAIDLCVACMVLGSPDIISVLDEQQQAAFVHMRANPNASANVETCVREWIANKFGTTGTPSGVPTT